MNPDQLDALFEVNDLNFADAIFDQIMENMEQQNNCIVSDISSNCLNTGIRTILFQFMFVINLPLFLKDYSHNGYVAFQPVDIPPAPQININQYPNGPFYPQMNSFSDRQFPYPLQTNPSEISEECEFERYMLSLQQQKYNYIQNTPNYPHPLASTLQQVGASNNQYPQTTDSISGKSNLKRKNDAISKTKVDSQTQTNIKNNHPLLSVPAAIFQAFNAGDFTKVRDLIVQYTTPTCTLKTPALEKEIIGRDNIIQLFRAKYETYPDAVWVAKKCKINLDKSYVYCRLYFAGTRMPTASDNTTIGSSTGPVEESDGDQAVEESSLTNESAKTTHGTEPNSLNPSSAASVQSNLTNQQLSDNLSKVDDLDSQTSHQIRENFEFLYKKKGSSLLDEMNVNMLSPAEIAAMRELENSCQTLQVFGTGHLILVFNPHDLKIRKFLFDWKVSSFREAEVEKE